MASAHERPASLHRGPSIALLPSDLLELIFSYIAFRPLLHVVSLVCKQWRTVALRSVTILPPLYSSYSAHLAIHLFPSITQLSFIDIPDPLPAIPARLCSLSMPWRSASDAADIDGKFAQVYRHFMHSPASLTHLTVNLRDDCETHDGVLDLIKSHSSTLQSLSLAVMVDVPLITMLRELPSLLPCLNHLTVRAWPWCSIDEFQAIAPLFTRVTSLSIRDIFPSAVYGNKLQLPRLRSLRFEVPDKDFTPHFLIDCASRLTDFSLVLNDLNAAYVHTASVLSFATKLQVKERFNPQKAEEIVATVDRCTRLKELGVPLDYDCETLLSPLSCMLVSIEVWSVSSFYTAMECCKHWPRLRKVCCMQSCYSCIFSLSLSIIHCN